MKQFLVTVSAVAITATGAYAGGIDRSGQGVGLLFEPGRVVELSFGTVNPSVDGTDIAGAATGNVAGNYTQASVSFKYDVNDKLSFGLTIDQPFGANIEYDAASPVLGGTIANASSEAITGLMRYKINDNFSVHGGVRAQRASATITLSGLAYGGLNGYRVDLGSDTAPGYIVGAAYERTDIAMRIALTYNSAIKHEFDTQETLNGAPIAAPGVTEVKTPQSVNLDFQSGIAPGTLLFGQIRWADWSNFQVEPAAFSALAGGGLIDLDDTITYTLGIGRRFNDNWAGSVSIQYEKEGDDLVSPLAPTNGRIGVSLAAIYTMDNMKITGGINYTKVGDAQPETGTPDTARANMEDNSSLGVGIKIAYTF
jgi:long-chain fatty acid transport protein